MEIHEFQVSKCTHHFHIPFSTCWSEDNVIATASEKGVYVASARGGVKTWTWVLVLVVLLSSASASDITASVFGSQTDVIPAAFGDINSDEYPDLFVIRNNHKTVEVLLGSDTEPLLRYDRNMTCNFTREVTSIIPGDFDGDGLLDVMVTVKNIDNPEVNDVRLLWGYLDHLKCKEGEKPLMRDEELKIWGQPLAMDYDQDMILDLFGMDENKERKFWRFNKNRTHPDVHPMKNENRVHYDIRTPHSHAFLDLNGDSSADLFVTAETGFEVWLWDNEEKFIFSNFVKWPHHDLKHVGQSLFLDIELKGKIDQILPVCFDKECFNSSVYVHSEGKWHNMKVSFQDSGATWGFVRPDQEILTQAITLRGGDFNMDGYPDLLATLQSGGHKRCFLLENVECKANCNGFSRTFNVRWNALAPYNNNTVLGVFYDFSQDGVLDIVFVHNKPKMKTNVSAFKNSLDYDANFIKVMVLTGKTNGEHPVVPTPLGKKRRTYGTSLPGPKIAYNTTTQEGNPRAAISTQLPQSAYLSLHLPYTLFGLGRTPNFVDSLTTGVAGHNRSWPQIIPNSQMVVIPCPPLYPDRWTAQLFVTPSKLIVQSVLALFGTCIIILIIVIALYWKERREDHFEKLQEAHRFHFDAM